MRPGDHVVWGQAAGEPLTLTRAIVENRKELQLGGVFVGAAFSDTLRVGNVDGLSITSYGTMGTTRPLAESGDLQVIPSPISRIASALREGAIRCDVAVVQISAKGSDGTHSMGPTDDYMRAAIEAARVVLVEINALARWTYGEPLPNFSKAALIIETREPLAELSSIPPTGVEKAIGHNVASLIPDGATLQVGIGGTIDAMLGCLADHRDLGIHSGAIGDGMIDLILTGAVTNSRKAIDTGISVTAGLFGSRKMFDHAHCNPNIHLRPYSHTHSAATLTQIDNLVAVNAAVEVDLSGQANAEFANGRYIGGVGGQVDFMHAATRSTSGFSVIALPSTAAHGTISRIRPRVDTVTCARSEIDFVVTEHGIADLRCTTIAQRIERIIAIAAPQFREALNAERNLFF